MREAILNLNSLECVGANLQEYMELWYGVLGSVAKVVNVTGTALFVSTQTSQENLVLIR